MTTRRWIVLSLLVMAALAGVLVWQGLTRQAAQTPVAELIFYCAAGVQPPVAEAARLYEKEYGVAVRLQYGGSGTLLNNMQVARRGDLYLAADDTYLDVARQKGLLAESIPLAYMRPVIAVRRGNPKNIRTLSDLLAPGVRVALGTPDAASIGKQTKLALEKTGDWDALRRHTQETGVFKPTVPEVANDVAIGAVDAGIVWDATMRQSPALEAVPSPALDAARQQISVGVLNFSDHPTDALRFARYLNSRIGNDIFKRSGYEPVEGDEWAWHPEITFFCGSINRRSVDATLRAFERREGVTINTVYNGCGILTGQMKSMRRGDKQGETGGFPDAYMACDRFYLNNVAEWFQDDVDVSEAEIVIAVPKGNPAGIRTLCDLTRPGVRVAVGQPDQCTIGALTRQLLQTEGLFEAVTSNVVMQTASSALLIPAVTTKSVDAAIAYNTDTVAERDKVDTIRIDSPAAKAIQPFSIARTSRYKYLGRRLLGAITAAPEEFERAGFRRPQGTRTTSNKEPGTR